MKHLICARFSKNLLAALVVVFAAGCALLAPPQPQTPQEPETDHELEAKIAELEEMSPIYRVYAYEPPVKLFPVHPVGGMAQPKRNLELGEWVDVLEYDDSNNIRMWCNVRTADGEYGRVNCTKFTARPYDPEAAAAKWEAHLEEVRGDDRLLDELPNYREVVKNWDDYEGKLAIIEETYQRTGVTHSVGGINTSTVHLDKRNAERGMSAIAWTTNEEPRGYYQVAIPFVEIEDQTDWYDGKSLKMVVELVDLYEGRRDEDRMPRLLAVAAFDGASFYEYELDRCNSHLSYVGERLLAVQDQFWGCVEEAGDSVRDCNPHTAPEYKWYEQAREQAFGCVNSFAWNPDAKSRYEELAKKVKSLDVERQQLWSPLMSLEPGTIKYEEALEAAQNEREPQRKATKQLIEATGVAAQ
jgi:hypothetical protein